MGRVINIPFKVLLLQRRISQRSLAKQTGIAESTLSLILHGFRPPTASQRRRLAKALGVTQDELFSESGY